MASTREQPGRYQRSTNGFVGSLLVLIVVIAGFVAFRGLTRGNQDEPVQTVDYAPLLKQARSQGVLYVPGPSPMPDGWRATSVRYVGTGTKPTWHLGILTNHDTYVGIEEARQPANAMVAKYLGKGADKGANLSINGTSWVGWRDGSAYALTRTTGNDTVFVGGPAGRKPVLALGKVTDFGSLRSAG